MIARGFQPVAWVAAIGTAALACYMLSLQVATERSELAGLESRILRAHQDIRSLQTELGTRGRLQQLEQWNAEVLALSAPVAGQFLENGLTLARFDTHAPPAAVEEQVRLASADVSAQPEVPSRHAALPSGALQTGSHLQSTPNPVQPLVRRASLTVSPGDRPIPTRAVDSPRRQPTTAVRTASASTPNSPSLLDESTLRELGAQARNETAGGAN